MTVIILTKNEEKNISECIESVKCITKRIVVIDSGSTDHTVSIAKELGAEVLHHPWENYSKQYIWGVRNSNINTKWIFRLDADERLTKESAAEIEKCCRDNENTDVNGIIVRFKVTFLGKNLTHGGIYPFKKLLIYKADKGYMEERNMDEHIVLKEGRSIELKNDSVHYDFKDLISWIDKHNNYSSREVLDYFCSLDNKENICNLNKHAKIKRALKFGLYYKMPLGMRAHLYYIYRYYLKLGFMDGREGKIFAFLQAYWYRYLVDAKIYEKRLKDENSSN